MPFSSVNTLADAPGTDAPVIGASVVRIAVGGAVLVGSIYTLSRLAGSVDETAADTDPADADLDLEAMDPTAL